MKTPEQHRHRSRSGVFIVQFENLSVCRVNILFFFFSEWVVTYMKPLVF